ncbi:unnamed protein product [Boreogadus saida]
MYLNILVLCVYLGARLSSALRVHFLQPCNLSAAHLWGSVDLTVCILEGLWASPLNISCVLVFTQKISLWSTHPSLKPDPCLCWDHLIRIKCCRLGSLHCFSLSIVDDHVLLINGFELVPE